MNVLSQEGDHMQQVQLLGLLYQAQSRMQEVRYAQLLQHWYQTCSQPVRGIAGEAPTQRAL